MTSIFLTGELSPSHVYQVYDARDEITELVIDSPGGDIQIGISIIQCLPKNIRTVALSECQSAAVYIFAAGMERVCLPSTTFLLHAGSMSINCDQATFSQYQTHGKKVEKLLSRLLPKELHGWDHGADRVFDGHTALAKGLATSLLSRKRNKPKTRIATIDD